MTNTVNFSRSGYNAFDNTGINIYAGSNPSGTPLRNADQIHFGAGAKILLDFSIPGPYSYTVRHKIAAVSVLAGGGQFNIAAPPVVVRRGDVNADAAVNMKDLMFLKRLLANWSSFSQINRANSDMDGNNQVNMLDLVLLARLLAQ